ncbi:MAG: hypothetical protein JWQ08_1212, partial [Deinococcus sp.]|nr:hypothetical protein [Deinococcus sp.]
MPSQAGLTPRQLASLSIKGMKSLSFFLTLGLCSLASAQ